MKKINLIALMRKEASFRLPKFIHSAYTLAEIIIVMLIIAVIVAVSIGITKAKLDNIVSYTYYNAYSSLRKISAEMLADWNPKDPEYKQAFNANNHENLALGDFNNGLQNPVFSLKNKIFNIYRDVWSQPALAACTIDRRTGCYYCGRPTVYPGPICSTGILCKDGGCWDCGNRTCPSDNICPDGYVEVQEGCGKVCANGSVANTPRGEKCPEELCNPNYEDDCAYSGGTFNMASCYCSCPSGKLLQGHECVDIPCPNKPTGPAPCGQHWSESSCSYVGTPTTCPSGYKLNTNTCECEKQACSNKPSGSAPCGQHWDENTCSYVGTLKTCPSGQHLNSDCQCVSNCPTSLSPCQKCDSETGVVSQNPDINRTCTDETYEWNEDQCKCVQSPRTLPRKGENFCKLFERHSNIMGNTDVCSGSVVSDGTIDFTGKKADITLGNGIRFYNMHRDATEIDVLAGNIQGGAYEGVPNTNSYGYTVYVDIDGAKGDSQLWSDVYPFYITLSGKIIPAYDKANPGVSGGDSTHHLQVSVQYEDYSSGKRRMKWLSKSTSFKEGACLSGYIGDATPYCKDSGAVTKLSECTTDSNSMCHLKQIQPVKFFF